MKSTKISRYNVVATLGSGRVGNVRLYQKGERNYVRAAYNSTINNPRTDAQMRQRLLFASTGNFYKAAKSYIKDLFEDATPYLSAANIFMTLNSGRGCYFTKMYNGLGAVTLDDYFISKGSLGLITSKTTMRTTEAAASAGDFDMYAYRSTISLGAGIDYDHGAITTRGQFSQIVLANNPSFRVGDVINIVQFDQRKGTFGIPSMTISNKSIILDPSSEDSFLLMNAESQQSEKTLGGVCAVGRYLESYVGSDSPNREFFLGYYLSSNGASVTADTAMPDDLGIAFVVTRGKACSSSLIGVRNSTVLTEYTTEIAFRDAVASYGPVEDTVSLLNRNVSVGFIGGVNWANGMPVNDTDIFTTEGFDNAIPAGTETTIKVSLTAAAKTSGYVMRGFGGIDKRDVVSGDLNFDDTQNTVSITFKPTVDTYVSIISGIGD